MSGDTVTIPLTCANAFADEVEFFDPLDIVWSYGLTSSGPWKEAGTRENQVYVTLGTPVSGTPVYHTLMHLGCKNAKGQSAEAPTFETIWSEFSDRSVVRVNASDPMDYWGAWASQNSQTVPPEVADSFFTTVGLLKNEDGRCEAWARFFADMLSVQGITTWELKVITPKETFIKVPELLLIKEWSSTVVPPPLISTVPPTAIGSIDAQGDSDPQQIFTNITGTASSYEWRVNGDTITGETESSLTYTLEETGRHEVKAILYCSDQLNGARVLATVPFTVTAIPAAGGRIQAAAGIEDGLDCTEGDVGKPECTEPYEGNAENVKVVPDAGYVFRGGLINDVPVGADDFITMVTGDSGALVKLEPEFEPQLELQSVTFSGPDSEFIKVVQDDGSSYPTPQWERTNPSPSPVGYVRNSRMEATVTLQTAGTIPDGTVYIKGDGPGELDFAAVPETLNGGTVSATLQSTALPDHVDYMDRAEFQITWFYADSAAGPWHEAGTSENLLHVTLEAPVTTATTEPFTRPVYHSLIHLGCESASGASTEAQVLSGIWQDIADLDVHTVNADGSEGGQLGYYYLGIPQVASTAALLVQHDGQSGAWVTFFLDTLRIQGLTYPNAHVWLVPRKNTRYTWILVQNWEWGCGSECASLYDDYLYVNLQNDPLVSFSPGNVTYHWLYDEGKDRAGIPGQKSPNPFSTFPKNHQVVSINGTYYDPSYGKEGDAAVLESFLLSGLGRGPQSDYVYEKATGLDLDKNGIAGEDKEVFVEDKIVWFMNPRGGLELPGLIEGKTETY